ncbi:chromatin-remodeling complex ATPase chain isw-1 [Purpureocillium lavendulum]|uniref:Chromatin-remodeling complex ATPase chain isw-1 n=1 Tax=Purpureocillium lavendulum TaxID=1247861 RepID=A0AB34G5J0_9HYPO|nr:chromatin-remodeling complex ATPase chain isw-1 [Purpureocillium lavendulum]
MESTPNHDPFLWGVDEVAEKLSKLQRPCTRNAAALRDTVQEHEVDGETLLTFEFVCSRQELFECLGIKLAGHKAALGFAIHKFRSESATFQGWKRDFNRQAQGQNCVDGGLMTEDGFAIASMLQPAVTSSGDASNGIAVSSRGASTATNLKRKAEAIENEPLPPDLSPPSDVANNPTKPTPSGLEEPEVKKQAKRMRVVPTLLTTVPVNEIPLSIATEADVVGYRAIVADGGPNTGEYPWEAFAPGAYLGQSSVPIHDFKSSERPVTSQLHSANEESFATIFPVLLPTGLRVVAGRLMRRLLIKNGRTEALLSQGIISVPPSTSADDDDVVDLHDLPDSFDEETLREIEAERAEMEAAKTMSQHLAQDVVQAILQEAINDFKAQWTEVKLPRYLPRAHKIWMSSQKRGTRRKDVITARQRAKFLDTRVRTLCAEIVDQTWTKEAEVRKQASCLDQTLAERLYCQWLADILESRSEPQKVGTASPLERRVREAKRPQSPTGSEVLTSSDEEDFIVPDISEEPMDGSQDVGSEDVVPHAQHATPVKADTPTLFVDLTEFETPEKVPLFDETTPVIDLTTPAKSNRASRAPTEKEIVSPPSATPSSPTASESKYDVEEIAKRGPGFWAKEGDRKRLVVSLLWALGFGRRSIIFEAVSSHGSHDFIEAMVVPILELTEVGDGDVATPNPLCTDTQNETRCFDVTRLFLNYIKVKYCKEERFRELFRHKKDRALLAKRIAKLGEHAGQEDSDVASFHALLKRVAPLFPQESQIVKWEISDQDLGELTADEDDLRQTADTPSRSRKKAPKELVQNKEGVDMRLREKRRVEEQAVRRRALRANLDALDIPSDRSRLIINEAKQDDDAFLYINDETAKRIKDHQIEGVRFLWNQIILQDDRERQGCLLAHTMGLGKTMQVITFLVAIQEAAQSSDSSARRQVPQDLRRSNTLVLCPAGLVDNWMDELLQWTPGDLLGPIRHVAALMDEADRLEVVDAWVRDGGILVVGYHMLQKLVGIDEATESAILNGPSLVIADEAHYLKNKDAKSHRICERFKTKCRIALTGTPLANNVEEYYSMVNWIAPNYLSTLDEFRQRFANHIQEGLWGDSLGWQKRLALKRLQELKETVAPKVHRATIQSLKRDLPPKMEFVLCIPATKLQQQLYEIYISDAQAGELSQAKVFKIVNDLMLLCNHPRCFVQKAVDQKECLRKSEKASKLPANVVTATLKEMHAYPDKDAVDLSMKTELLCVILDEAKRVKDKVLVFSQSVPTLDYLMYILRLQRRRVSRLDGATVIAKRQDMVKEFNNGEQEVYLISTTAGGIGLNIQGANRVVIFDYKWNPVQEQQAIGRAYRIGQPKPVYVYRFMVAGSFEEDLHNKAVFKTQLASRVVDKKNPVSWSKRLGGLVHPLRKVPAKDLTDFVGKDVVLDKLISYKPRGAAIRFIVSTDTFEEEDPTGDLTPEELQEVGKSVKRNLLRATDPEGYERLLEEERQAEALRRLPGPILHHPNTVQAAPPPATAPLPRSLTVLQSTDGAFDENVMALRGENGRKTNTPVGTPHQLVAAPAQAPRVTAALQPVPGANTYFGEGAAASQSNAKRPSQDLEAPAAPRTPVRAQGAGFAIFSPRKESRDRKAFEQTLCTVLKQLQQAQFPGVGGEREGTVRNVADKIERHLKAGGLGFLKEDQRWQLLHHLVHKHVRFAAAMVSGHFTLHFVAMAPAEDLRRRLDALDGLPDGALKRHLASEPKAAEHHNLLNLRRPSSVADGHPRSPRAQEDLRIMREAAAKRQERSSLPRR